MKLEEFDYNLPKELIAQLPSEKRENSKMLVLNRQALSFEDKHFYDITDFLDENDFLVMNNTKVIPARLFSVKDTGAKIEIFLVRETEPHKWIALIKPSKRVKPLMELKIGENLSAKIIEKIDDKWKIQLNYCGNIYDVLGTYGNIPLPPYIERNMTDSQYKSLDFDRYQTVYAKHEGSVAAPTAGLHFTRDIIDKLEKKGVGHTFVNLNVGLGTFKPVKAKNIEEHSMDRETFEISEEAANSINKAKAEGKNIVAVGTTSVRTLETTMRKYGKILPVKDYSELFIYPPYDFKIVDKMITNFHLPKSTLLMLVSAFAGKDFVFKAYNHAINSKYRFYSYGDCMLIL